MAKIRIKLEREDLIKAIVILTAVVFLMSTVSLWFTASKNGGGSTASDGSETKTVNITTAQAIINVTLDYYTSKIMLNELNEVNKEYMDRLNEEGKLLYYKERDTGVTILLADKEYTYQVAKNLMKNDANISMILEGVVHSDEEYAFQPINEVGNIIKSKIPASKITLNYPFEVGSTLQYQALAQFVDGKMIRAKLYPKGIKAKMKIPFLVEDLLSKYYGQMIFRWSDRVKGEEHLEELNESLQDVGAVNVSFNYITDHSVYTSRILTKEETDKLEEYLPGLKGRDGTRLIFYSNYSYTEEDVYDAINKTTNGSVEVSFAISYLEITFDYNGNSSIVDEILQNYSVKPMYYKLWRLAKVSTGEVNAEYQGKKYPVNEMKRVMWVPEKIAEENKIVSLGVTGNIEGDRVVDVSQNILEETPFISTEVQSGLT